MRNYRTLDSYTDSTAGLLGKVMGIVGIGFFFTAAGSWLGAGLPNWLATTLGIANIALIFAISSLREQPTLQLAAMYLFTFIEGGALGPVLKHYVHKIGPTGVAEAALITALGMLIMAAVAYLFNINYQKLSGIGFAALLVLLVVMIVSIFVHFISPTVLDWLVLAVFTIITIADFARLRAGGGGGTAVELALSIYLDALNIFLAVLELLGASSSSSKSSNSSSASW